MPPLYKEIENLLTKKIIFRTTVELKEQSGGPFCIHDFPSYLKATVNQNGKSWKLNIIDTYKGSTILLKNYTGLKDYLEQNFSAKKRSQFRTYEKRLETAFNVEYKTYYGEITEKEFTTIFDEFLKMITRRFSQKGMENDDLKRWSVYKEIAFPLINKKEAVLFVIFHDKKPISICMNIIYDKIIYGYIRSYDIDYSKFYLGFIDFIKQLEWYFKHDFEIFDLLKGQYEYKMKWADGSYCFQKHIIYNPKSLSGFIKGMFLSTWIMSFYNVVRLLKRLKFDLLFHKLMDYKRLISAYFSKQKSQNERMVIYPYIESNINEILIPIRLDDPEYDFLRKTVYDFLYANQESLDHIKIVKLSSSPKSFIIKSKKKSHRIAFEI